MIYDVYIMMSANGTLYIGFTNDLIRRVQEHKEGLITGFSSKYKITKLVYYAEALDPTVGIAREKQLKGWTRKKKLALIADSNPAFEDLSGSL